MKRAVLIVMAAALLTACGSKESPKAADISAAQSSVSPSAAEPVGKDADGKETGVKETVILSGTFPVESSEPEPDSKEASEPEEYSLLADWDFTFTAQASVFNRDKGEYESYEGEFSDITRRDLVCRMLKEIRPLKVTNYAKVGGYDRSSVKIRHQSGITLNISTGIAYESEMVEGGPTVFVIDGLRWHDKTQTVYCETTERFSASWFADFCRTASGAPLTDEDIPAGEGVKLMDTNIAAIYRVTNFSEGAYDGGTFLDREGDLYRFEFVNGDRGSREIPSEEELVSELEKIRETQKPVGKGSKEDMDRILRLASHIPDDAEETVMEYYCCDAGQDTLYVVTDRLVKLGTIGDHNAYLDDMTAIKTMYAVHAFKNAIEITE